MSQAIKLALAAGIIAASIAPTVGAHTDAQPCNGTLKMYNGNGAAGSNTIYNDHRSPVLVDDPAIPQELENPLVGPPTENGTGGSWVYMEFNDHKGLQTGGEHVLLGANGSTIGATDPCDSIHGGAGAGPDLLIF